MKSTMMSMRKQDAEILEHGLDDSSSSTSSSPNVCLNSVGSPCVMNDEILNIDRLSNKKVGNSITFYRAKFNNGISDSSLVRENHRTNNEILNIIRFDAGSFRNASKIRHISSFDQSPISTKSAEYCNLEENELEGKEAENNDLASTHRPVSPRSTIDESEVLRTETQSRSINVQLLNNQLSTNEIKLSSSDFALMPGAGADTIHTDNIHEAEHNSTEHRIRSSKSVERRLSEAAQYAEAVGETPPKNVGEISQEIIEESSDDEYDDDDGNEDYDAITQRVQTTSSIPDERGNQVAGISTSQQSFCSLNGRHREEPKKDIILSLETNDLAKEIESTSEGNGHKKDSFIEPIFGDYKDLHNSLKSLLNGLPYESKRPPTPSYRGLHANPPEVTKQGLSRGNYAQLHRKAWLEVSDKYHRYGKNLRCYYKHWENLGHPTNMFFDWLDSKGEAAGQPLPNLPEYPRLKLDSDTVLYVTNPNVTARYALTFQQNENGMTYISDVNGDPVNTGENGWIFVLRDGVVYAAPKVTSISGKSKQRFHHSSFFGGKAVASAGILVTNEHGQMTRLYPHSGHYRPGEAHMQRMLFFLQRSGIELSSFEVDMQQIFHVSRKDATPEGKANTEMDALARKAKKVDSLHLLPATYVACYLAHKALMIGEGVFAQIHKTRRVRATSVKEALDIVNNRDWDRKYVEVIE